MIRPIDTVIDVDECIGCGECLRVCPTDAFTMDEDKAIVSGSESIGCGHCAAVCPTDAITVGFTDENAVDLASVSADNRYVEPGEYDTSALVRLMGSRRSCRNYQERAVPREMLEDLVKIGTTAPSGTNCQLWTFAVIPDRSGVLHFATVIADFYTRLNRQAANPAYRLIARLMAGDALGKYYRSYYESVEEGLRRWREEGHDLLFHGTTAIILVGNSTEATCPAEDSLLATQNILLAAHAMGLGTCLIGFAVEAIKRDASLRSRLELAADERIYSVIALGWPNESYERPAGRRRVKPRFIES